ncbi:MAG: bifunctional riboflavin kinase/FAD synthetase [Aquificae bacterium]|nr:bifunctional riboflavin kinase/FAD synthetase [Aquificota bacterium]
MKVLTEADLPLKEKTVATIGNFDGFHLGHVHVVKQLVKSAEETGRKSLAITFEPHPKKVLQPENPPCRIINLETKIDLFTAYRIDYLYIIRFDREFARKTPEEFMFFLKEKLGVEKLIIGHDWRFGREGKGTTQTAVEIGKKLDIQVSVASPFKVEGKRISSTIIRELLKEGKVDKVVKYLGRDYFLIAHTVSGNKLGTEIGFPTLNLIPPEDLCLKKGVYSGLVEHGGRAYPSVINYGRRPTVDGKKLLIEAHLIGREVYLPENSKIKVVFKKFLREEKKFSDLNQLKKQIQTDINSAMKLLEVRQ